MFSYYFSVSKQIKYSSFKMGAIKQKSKYKHYLLPKNTTLLLLCTTKNLTTTKIYKLKTKNQKTK